MEIIEKYILFAINNDWITNKIGITYKNIRDLEINNDILYFIVDLNNGETQTYTDDLIRTITSKKFINTIVRGLEKQGYSNSQSGMVLVDIDLLTEEQAIAIREKVLEQFIVSLGIQ